MFGTSSIRRIVITTFGVVALVLTTAGPAAASDSYIVSPGDTLYGIALRHGLTVDMLVQLNGIQNPNLIYAGQQISLSGHTGGEGVAGSPVSGAYTVQPGDTLWSIASRFGISVAQLVEANRDSVPDQNLIYPGQQLSIPAVGGAPSGGQQPAPPANTPSGDIGTILEQTAVSYGVDPNLVKAIAWQESGWQQGVVSSAGALGVMQVMPATGGWISSDLVGRPLDIQGSVHDNVLAGVVYLEWLIRYTGSEEQALASYYQGPGSVSQVGWFGETYQYVANVQSIRTHFQQYGTPPGA